MTRISKINDFVSDFESKYGLDAGGSCYIVKNDFYLEIISSYEDDKSIEGPLKYINPVWSKIKVTEGDLISVTKNGCFIEIKEVEGFVECRPEPTSKEMEPKLDRFPDDYLEKIGNDIISSKPMSFEERKKIIITRA
jgi:hypothetical protein